MQVEIKGGKLVITLPLAPAGTVSKSGKSITVASSNGNQKTGVMNNGKEIIVGVNAYSAV